MTYQRKSYVTEKASRHRMGTESAPELKIRELHSHLGTEGSSVLSKNRDAIRNGPDGKATVVYHYRGCTVVLDVDQVHRSRVDSPPYEDAQPKCVLSVHSDDQVKTTKVLGELEEILIE